MVADPPGPLFPSSRSRPASPRWSNRSRRTFSTPPRSSAPAAVQAEWAAAAAAAREADAEERKVGTCRRSTSSTRWLKARKAAGRGEAQHRGDRGHPGQLWSRGASSRRQLRRQRHPVRARARQGVPVRKITALQNDLALSLAALIRIQAPIPGKPAVGIEVPNKASALVTLREIIQSPGFQSPGNVLAMPIGSDVSGQPITGDLSRMPHVLIAGATGSGKSVCVNALLAGFMLRHARPAAAGPDRPQARRDVDVQGPAPPAGTGGDRGRSRGGRAALGGHRDGELLQALRLAFGAQHRRLQCARPRDRARGGSLTSSSSSTSWPT